MVASSSSSGFAFTLDTGSPPLFDSTVVCVWLFLTRRESVPGGSLFPCSLVPFQNFPMFACSHAFSLFDPLLIHLLTTYHRPQFPPAKQMKRRKKDSKSKTYKTRE